MSEDQICPIWGTPASVKPGNGDFDHVDSPRAGGKYRIARRAQIILRSEDDSIKARLTSWVIEQHQSGEDDPKITEHTLNDVEQRPALPLEKRIDNLLTYIQQTVPQIGGRFTFSRGQNNRGSMKMLAWSESINIDEVKALMDHLEEYGWLKKGVTTTSIVPYTLTVEGYSRVTEPEQTMAQEPKLRDPNAQPLTRIAEREQEETMDKPPNTQKVFVVHGRDHAPRNKVDIFLRKLGHEPVILEEQPSGSKTVIEKFEANSDVDFAVVILTPDDVGNTVGSSDEPQGRARQNVIFELGFFVGKLGREKVCVLQKGTTEIPSDFHGVVYVPMDETDGWHTKLAREMEHAGVSVDLNRLK